MTSLITRYPISAAAGAFLAFGVVSIASLPKAGGALESPDSFLRKHYSTDDYKAVKTSTRVAHIYHCQSALASSGSGKRPRPGLVNHDYVVVAATAEKSDGQHVDLFIIAEKQAGDSSGGRKPGIYVNALTRTEYENLEANKLYRWDGYSTLVPLDVLTSNLQSAHDPDYNVFHSNCWGYSHKAIKTLLLLLSRQPDVNEQRRQDFIANAMEVKTSIIKFVASDILGIFRGFIDLNQYNCVRKLLRVRQKESFRLCR